MTGEKSDPPVFLRGREQCGTICVLLPREREERNSGQNGVAA